jgi:uncharacterized protein (TIGR00369 family)
LGDVILEAPNKRPMTSFELARQSFDRQGAMHTLGASLARVSEGFCEITLPFRPELSQQHGFFHAGVVSTIADTAGGFAAFTLFPEGSSVLTVEFKINLLAPADGEHLRATGKIIKHGKTLTVCEIQAHVTKAGREKLCAHGMSTLICLRDRPGISAG